jgi:hypothetical protein
MITGNNIMDTFDRKKDQLGIHPATAQHRLKKIVVFDLVKRLGENICYRCKKEIISEDDLSLEHKIAWLDNSPDLFWDLENIAWSHLSCNIRAARRYKTNSSRGKTRGKSKHLGVSYNACQKRKKRWLAQQRFGNKKRKIGYFHTEEEAANAIKLAGGYEPK